MKGQLNIYRDNFLEKEELDRLMSFINDNIARFLFVSNAQSFGIIQQGASLGVDPAFKIEVGTNVNTIKLTTASYALDSDGNLIVQKAFDNLPIPTDSAYYWVKISHRADHYEDGFVNIALDGTLSGVGTKFTEVLRGASSGFPVKVRFYTQADDGTLTPATNSGIYEVNSIASDTVAILNGGINYVVETNLRMVVLGAFSIKTSVAAITSTGLYSYDSCQIDLVAETVVDTPPTTGYTADEDFYVARVMSDGATVTVQDKRSNYYFRLNFGDIIVDNKAATDASNLAASDITAWLTKLSVLTSAQVTSALTSYMLKSQNLNDVANKTTARSNLGVYSTTYVDDLTATMKRKIVNIGDWEMDGNVTVTVAHGIADFTKIRSVSAMIRSDDTLTQHPLDMCSSTGATEAEGGVAYIDATNVILARHTGGFFDSASFDLTGFNRGWIIIDYLP